MKKYLLLIGLSCSIVSAFSQTSYTWNGSLSTSWNTAGNWTPNGIPGAADNVTIVTGSNTCKLNAATTIGNLTLTSGTLDMAGFTLTAGGTTATFTTGTVQNGALTVPAATTTVFGNGPVTMNCAVNITSATITIKNTTFQQTVAVTKTGSTNDASSGGNTFNGVSTFTNAGSGYLLLANNNPDQFNNTATFNNTGSANLYVAHNSTGNVFTGLVTFNNTPTANTGIYVSGYSTGTVFNNNIVVSSTNGSGVQFCYGNTTATATLTAGNTITIGAGGFSAGNLSLKQFTQAGNTAQSLTLTGTGDLVVGPSSTFNGNFISSSPALNLDGATFNGTSDFTKTGATGDWSTGGNVFNGVCSITNSGSSYLVLGNSNPDTWNTDVTFTDNGSERLLPGWASAGNQFNGNIYVNTAGSAQGIQFCGGNATATATLAAGKTIQAGSTGLTAGYLYLKQFTENGSAPITLTGTGTSSVYLGPSSSFGGAVTITAPDIWAQGATYAAAAAFTKTGGSNNHNNQYQNIFNSTCTINQQSSSGYFMLGYNSNDLFNDNITVTSIGSGGIYLGWTSGTGTPTLAAGKTIQIGGAGFSAGFLYLNTFTQLGSAPLNLTFTGANTGLYFARNSVIGGNTTITAPDIYFNGCTFNGTVTSTKTGAGGDFSQGGNVFNGVCSITNSGTSYVVLGNSNPDIWNSDVTFTDNGTERILPGWGSTGNQFNGNIYVNTVGSAQGIQFCGGNATATATLAAGKTIQAGAFGLNAGYLILKQFTQAGNAPVNLTLSSSASYLQFGPLSAIGGDVVSSSPGLDFNGCTFGGAVTATKTGAGNDAGSGNNIFTGVANITNAGSGYLMFGNNNADQFNNTATFNNTGSANLYVAYNSTNNVFNGAVTFNNTPTGNTGIYVSSYSAGTAFNNTITVSSTNGTGVQFCNNSVTAGVTLANTLSVGPAGFTSGTLLLRQFTQTSATAENLTLTGTANLTIGPSSAFNGSFTSSSPTLFLNGATFGGTSDFTKTGTTGDWSQGGNVFNGICSITNSGSSYLLLGSVNPDTWNGDVTFTDNGSERLLPCWSSVGNQFNGNITVNTAGSAQGIQFCGGNNTATATLAAGKTIQAGSTGLTAGYLYLKQFTQLGNVPITLTSGAGTVMYLGPSSNFGGAISVTAPDIWAQGATYNGAAAFTKTGGSNNHNQQYQNIFNSTCTINQQSSTGYFMLGYNSNDLFNDDITVTSTGTGGIYLGWTGGTGTPTLAAGHTIQVGPAGFSTGFLYLNTFTQLGSAPISLTFTGTNTSLYFARSSVIGGNTTISAPDIYFNGCTFNGSLTSTKTGAGGDYSQGGNTFNGVCSITNSGSGFAVLGNSSPDTWNSDVTFTDNGSERLLPCWGTAGNQFNGNIYVNTSGSAQGIQFCGANGTATAFLAAGKGIQTGSLGLNAGYLILKQFTQAGNAPVNLTLSSTATYLQFGPSSALGGNVVSSSPGLYFNGCTFSGTVTSTKTGATNDQSQGNNIFNGVANITNAGSGYLMLGNGNKDQFNTDAAFNNTGSANLYVAYNSVGNTFGGQTTFTNIPTANTGIYVSPNSAGTVFNGNILVNSTNGQGVLFCSGNSTATATLSSGYTIAVGSTGFSAGTLLLRQFTQAGSTAQNITLTGAGNLTFGPSSAIGGNITTVSPTLFYNGCVFSGAVTSTKNGGTNDASIGNNTFGGAFTVTNTGAGYFLMGNGNPDIWQSTAVFNNQSTAQHMYVAYNSTGNTFNGDVTFNNQPGATGLWIYTNNTGTNTQFNGNISVENVNGAGVYFGNGSGTASLTGTIGVGAAGFNSGGLILKNFTQTGAGAAQTITTTGTSYIQYGTAATFAGPVTSSSPGLFFSSATFNNTVNCTKTGSSNDQSAGNNIFNGASTFTNTGTGYLLMTNSSPDAYNNDVTFVKSGSGAVYPNYNTSSTYAGNLTVNAATSITFGANTGTAVFTGSGVQNINATAGSAVPVFTRLVIDNTGGGVVLNTTSINVSGSLTLTSGLLGTSAAHILTMLNGSTTAAGTATSTSYVNGPMRYQKSSSGITTLNFPIGTAVDCRPVVLTVNHTNGTLYNYTAQLFDASAAALNYTFPPTVTAVSHEHYYTIGRTDNAGTNQPTAGLSGNQTIQIFFGTIGINDWVSDGSTLTIVKNTYTATTSWIDIGGTGGPAASVGAALTGSITSTSSPTAFNSFSTFAIANKITGANVLPTELLYFNAKPNNSQVDLTWGTAMEMNNSYFTVERSKDGINFEFLARVGTQAYNGNSSVPLTYAAYDLSPYSGTSYYRLQQTDLDGRSKYSNVVAVNFTRTTPLNIYPNPSMGTVFVSGLSDVLGSVKVEWFDLGGKLLVQELAAPQGGTIRLNTHFNNGDYILKLTGADGSVTTKTVIIMR